MKRVKIVVANNNNNNIVQLYIWLPLVKVIVK